MTLNSSLGQWSTVVDILNVSLLADWKPLTPKVLGSNLTITSLSSLAVKSVDLVELTKKYRPIRGGGSIAQRIAYLFPDPTAPGLIPSVPKNCRCC